MIRLLFIVPYPELKDKVEYVVAHHPESQRLNADIRVMTVEDTLDVPADQYDAIIARGYSALKTSAKYTQIPCPNAVRPTIQKRSQYADSAGRCMR